MKTILFPAAPLENPEWHAVDQTRVVSGAPAYAYTMLYSSASGEFNAGIYECTAGSWNVSYTEDEFCTLLEGEVRLSGDDGALQVYQAPQSFVIPAGFNGIWEAVTPVRKYFITYERVS